jgi:lysophospholipase L1-like esterase
MYKLLAMRKQHKGRLRIAWLGDSEIEGDIFTQDIRHLMQKKWGGQGVGFVPITTHVPGFRKSVDFTFSGNWLTYSLADIKTRKSKKPWMLNGELFIAPGQQAETDSIADSSSIPKAPVATNAWVHYSHPTDSFTNAYLVYGSSAFDIAFHFTIDGDKQTGTLPPSPLIDKYPLATGRRFKSLKVNLPTGNAAVYYGVSFEGDKGIYLDNYSLRGAAGLHLMAVQDDAMTAFNSLFNYDLIVLQYGLNVAKKGTHDYSYYGRNLEQIINRLHKLMPHTAILLVGVSDRGAKIDGTFQTMPEVEELLAVQKTMAQKTGCAFWSAFDAMGGEGSMVSWADEKPSVANKDYTHLKAEGGKRLANYFMYAWLYEVNKYAWLKKQPHA